MNKTFFKILAATLLLLSLPFVIQAKELAGVNVNDEITLASGDKLILNGMGLREKLWIDVYVGSLYLPKKADNVAGVLSQAGALRIQMNFVYKEVSSKQFISTWKEGFEKNQTEEKMKQLQEQIKEFYAFFEESAMKGDIFIIDYIPGEGTHVSKNDAKLGIIKGEEFKNALVEIFLGNYPADKGLKKGMLGLGK